MLRRTFLVTFASGAAAGCLDASDTTATDGGNETLGLRATSDTNGTNETESATVERRYRRCDRVIVPYASLPDDVRAEFDAAREDGRYATDGTLYLLQALDPSVSYVERDGTYYRPDVTQEGGETVLRVAVEDRPTLPTGRTLTVGNGREEPVTAAIADDGRTVAGPEVVEPGAITSFRREVVGTYALRVRGEDGFAETVKWPVSERYACPTVAVTDDGLDVTMEETTLEGCW
ncbi:hypothetical protein ACFQPA_14150 [Halomarina halobia]|uniref:Carboxypeptidase regulatory-like domain-containing protein n=1 Tax=Halomarina halobia TaxID=3033386 RepID=A0ABD6A847_9EURY|nr:hypothetical protein [Halomarina sp. PSR21]